jgi:hypothetical protein
MANLQKEEEVEVDMSGIGSYCFFVCRGACMWPAVEEHAGFEQLVDRTFFWKIRRERKRKRKREKKGGWICKGGKREQQTG